jgi:sortase A
VIDVSAVEIDERPTTAVHDETRREKLRVVTQVVPSRHTVRTVLRAGTNLILIGCVALAAFLLGGSALVHDREQRTLQREFRAAAANITLDPQFEIGADGLVVGMRRVPIGGALARVRIPAIGMDEILVEGTSSDQTRRGPGHLSSSPLPGQFGNSVVIGRRTSYGGPFRHLDQLRSGDRIEVAGGLGDLRYVVSEVVVAPPDDASVFGTLDGRNTLTLVTSDSRIAASGRLVAVAELQGRAQGFSPSSVAPRDAELGLGSDRAAWVPFVFALQALLVVSLFSVWLATRWSRSCAWLAATPLLIASSWLVFEQATRLLPATL